MRNAHLTYGTEEWPRRTRLDLQRAFDGDAVAEPTQPVPAVPMPQRKTPPPDVKPIPRQAVRQGLTTAGPGPVTEPADPDESRLTAADLVNRVLDEQHNLNVAGSQRLDALAGVRRVGLGGVFGWRPLTGPSVQEVAAARQRAADREARRKHAHAEHMDRLEAARAYVKLAILVGLFVLVVAAGYEAFMIITGHYAWAPTRVK